MHRASSKAMYYLHEGRNPPPTIPPPLGTYFFSSFGGSGLGVGSWN